MRPPNVRKKGVLRNRNTPSVPPDKEHSPLQTGWGEHGIQETRGVQASDSHSNILGGGAAMGLGQGSRAPSQSPSSPGRAGRQAWPCLLL